MSEFARNPGRGASILDWQFPEFPELSKLGIVDQQLDRFSVLPGGFVNRVRGVGMFKLNSDGLDRV